MESSVALVINEGVGPPPQAPSPFSYNLLLQIGGLRRASQEGWPRVGMSGDRAQAKVVRQEADKLRKFLTSVSFLFSCLQSLSFIVHSFIDLRLAVRELIRWPSKSSMGGTS